MSALNKLACSQNRKDEILNQQLAKQLANNKNIDGIKEIAENLWNKDRNIQNDCLKVLYEIGYINPELVGDYIFDFLRLLKSKNNRLVWGGMIALSTIAEIKSKEIFDNLDEILNAIEKGSVITVDNGIKTLSKVASTKKEYGIRIFPYLINHLKNCRPKEIPMHAKFIMYAVNSDNKNEFAEILEKRKNILKPSQVKRIEKIFKHLGKI